MYSAKDVARAKELEKIEKNLMAKFRKAERESSEQHRAISELNPVVQSNDAEADLPSLSPPSSLSAPLTVSSAKKLEAMEKSLRERFAGVQKRQLDVTLEQEKRYEPILRTIKEQQQLKRKQENTVAQNIIRRPKVKIKRLSKPIPYPKTASTPLSTSHVFPHPYETTPSFSSSGDETTTDSVRDSEERLTEEEEPQEKIETPSLEEEAVSVSDDNDTEDLEKRNVSVKQIVDSNVLKVGELASSYLLSLKDSRFGIWMDDANKTFHIGSEPITFAGDDIVLKGKQYKGTEGLWILLTTDKAPTPDQYSEKDLQNYKEMLRVTNSMYQRNDPTQRPKSSKSVKWKHFIKHIWTKHYKPGKNPINVSSDGDFSGSGLKKYSENPVEYKYINNLAELVKRLQFIDSQEAAGNNNFHNEKLSVVQFLHDRMEELIDTPNGLKYLVRCLSALPERVIKGSGLLNDIINLLPFELHAPRNWRFDSYNYCGPGTKLKKRLARGDEGVNPLDEACKEHDIWYSKHKNTEDRWVADKVLQQKAWDRVTAPDADLNERVVGLATTGGMWLKRKLGMGLGTSASLYPSSI